MGEVLLRRRGPAGNPTPACFGDFVREDSDDPLYLIGDHLGSTSLVINSAGQQVAKQSYLPFGEDWGVSATDLPTDFTYTGQREAEEIGLMYYVARWYDSDIGHFIQADTIVQEIISSQAFDRFAYVENNPIRYVDPNGFAKVIIFYGVYDDGTNSFRAAAETQKQKALDAGYVEEDILMVEVSSDYEFFAAIESNDLNEIEEVYVMSHGWGIDYDGTQGGGLQLSTGEEDDLSVTTDDLFGREYLEDRFADDAEITLFACQVADGTFAQALANTFGSSVYAYNKSLKFFRSFPENIFYPITVPYDGGGDYNPNDYIEMSPYIGFWPLPILPILFSPE